MRRSLRAPKGQNDPLCGARKPRLIPQIPSGGLYDATAFRAFPAAGSCGLLDSALAQTLSRGRRLSAGVSRGGGRLLFFLGAAGYTEEVIRQQGRGILIQIGRLLRRSRRTYFDCRTDYRRHDPADGRLVPALEPACRFAGGIRVLRLRTDGRRSPASSQPKQAASSASPAKSHRASLLPVQGTPSAAGSAPFPPARTSGGSFSPRSRTAAQRAFGRVT